MYHFNYAVTEKNSSILRHGTHTVKETVIPLKKCLCHVPFENESRGWDLLVEAKIGVTS